LSSSPSWPRPWLLEAFAASYGAKFPKAAAKITQDEEELPSALPMEWPHPRSIMPEPASGLRAPGMTAARPRRVPG